MQYLLCNMNFKTNSIVENQLDHTVFKELAFNSKISIPIKNNEKSISYNYVLIPIRVTDDDVTVFLQLVGRKIFANSLSDTYVKSLYTLLKDVDHSRISSIEIISVLDYTDLEVTYTDGSFKKSPESPKGTLIGDASYGVVKLLEESPAGKLCEFSNKNFLYKGYSGIIKDGSNNVGELNGIKVAADNFGEKLYQLVISDSEYSIKIYREWYYNWKNNNWKTSSKKEVKNKELIQSIHKSITDSGKIMFYKWTEGHKSSEFNNLCDELAKSVLFT